MNSSALLRGLLLVAVAAATLCATRSASAQLTRADSAAVLLAVADDFADRGVNDIAEALYRHISERFPGTAAAEAARALVAGVAVRQSRAGGEVELKVWSALYGIWQGIAIPVAAGSDEPATVGMGLLLGGPAGFLMGRELARLRPRSLGQARAITWGGTWGAIQGWGWARALDLGSGGAYAAPGSRNGGFGDDESTEAALTAMIVGGAAGIAGGAALARSKITSGTATSAMLGSLWGIWIGFSTAYLADVEGDGLTAAAMMAGNAGLVVGAVAGSRMPLSRSRARLISVGGVVGAFGGVGITLIGQPDDGKTAVGTILAGSVAGLAVGAATTGDDPGEPEESGEQAAAALPPAPGALLNWSDRGWALSAPVPSTVRLSNRRGDRDGLVWKFPLLKVRF